MPRFSRLALAAALVAALPACSFSEGGDFDCTDGATVTGTIDGRAFRADCVETSIDADGLFFGAYDNYDAQDGTDIYSNVRVQVGGASAATYPLSASGTSTLSYFISLGGDHSDDVSADATAGSVVITGVTDSAITGTFQFTAPEELFNNGSPTPTGETITGTGSFSIPR